MNLFWLVHRIDDDMQVNIQPGHSLIDARMKAALAGQEGEFVEGHLLDGKTTKKVPKRMIGKNLSAAEAKSILKRLA